MKVFPESSLLTFEFEQVKELLRGYCISNMGKAEVKAISLSTDFDQITILLNRTFEMRQIIASGLPFPSSGYIDISKELGLLRIENSVLNEDQFMAILTNVNTVKELFGFFKNRKGVFLNLEGIFADTVFEVSIIKEIEAILDEHGVVRTSASPELTRIRRSLQRSRADADRIFMSVVNKYRKQGWLAEAEESSRNGRRVLAINAEQKRTLRGIIHDSSATGKTSFLEPEETVIINNTIALLEQEERTEVLRILKQLSATLRRFVPVMQLYLEHLGTFDLNRSKALFAIEIDGKLPKLTNEPVIDLKNARHPLLIIHNKVLNKPTVPFSLNLNHEQRILVISGPNAGGKTVCMKTSGLLQMMLQAGLLVSAHDDSVMGIFENLMVDIGDSQSIEYELSTYSSRLRHMRIFLERVNEKSLFLIDEFGTGTDPNLGGALAEAVLEELNNRKSFGIITTHYLNLKTMAGRTPGIINGSMEFDLKRLRPMYRLVIGKPGSSYTFLVAERSGLPGSVIKNARRKVPKKNLLLEKLLTDAQKEKEQLQFQSENFKQNNDKAKELIKKYETLSKNAEERFTAREQKLKKNEEKLLRETEERFRSFLKEWKKAKDKKEVFDKYYKLFVQKKRKEDPEAAKRKRIEKLKILKTVIKPGVVVRLENGHTTGVVEQVDGEKAFVIFGQFRTVCDMGSLEVVEIGH